MNLTYSMPAVRSRLKERLPQCDDGPDGDFLLNPGMRETLLARPLKPAAVLIAMVERGSEVKVILTKRTQHLASHSGQVAFPGGKIDAEDASPEAAAAREAWEEIGLDQGEVEIVGRLPDYVSGSGFLIAPVIGLVSSTADFEINHDEVEYCFEVPLQFLMDEKNHKLSSREFEGNRRYYYEMPYENHYIWGVTAGMIRVFHERIFKT